MTIQKFYADEAFTTADLATALRYVGRGASRIVFAHHTIQYFLLRAFFDTSANTKTERAVTAYCSPVL